MIERAEKKGYALGIYARHPFQPKVRLPVYAANFVLMGYGEGAILAAQPMISGTWTSPESMACRSYRS